jgi:Flp pilus assembly protein TadG
MRRRRFLRNSDGTAAIEFALTSTAFIMLLIGIVEGGLALWTQIGIQHGAEMAARCATVNKTTCGSDSAIQTYAASESFGISPPASTFTHTTPACGNKVTASYSYTALTEYFGMHSFTLTGSSCFPK